MLITTPDKPHRSSPVGSAMGDKVASLAACLADGRPRFECFAREALPLRVLRSVGRLMRLVRALVVIVERARLRLVLSLDPSLGERFTALS